MNSPRAGLVVECLNCGYDLTSGSGVVLPSCPECGCPASHDGSGRWRERLDRLGLTLALWGVPVIGLAGLLATHSFGSFSAGGTPGLNTLSVSRAVSGVLEFGGVALLITGALMLRGSPESRVRVAWLLGVTSVLALFSVGSAVQPGALYAWHAMGIARNSWPDRVVEWVTQAAYSAVGMVLLMRTGDLFRRTGLPSMARWAAWLAIGVAIVGTLSPIVEWIGREISSQWTPTVGRSGRLLPAPRQGPASGGTIAPPPWYAQYNAIVLLFWTAPLKGGVLAAAWGVLLLARARLVHVSEGSSPGVAPSGPPRAGQL
jgi:hypothetical protein